LTRGAPRPEEGEGIARRGFEPTPEALGQLAAAMVHEARSPLNAASIHLELLGGRLDREPLSGEAAEAARRSLRALREAVERVDRVLTDYVRAVGPADEEPRSARAHAVLEAAAARAATRLSARGLRLAIEADERDAWRIDATAVGVALDALIARAALASPPAGVIRVIAARAADACEIAILDEGEWPERDDSPRSVAPGADLGLVVARQAVKGLGGSLALRPSATGRGTEAVISLPLDDG
jgi:signal transduction histidine kinase